MIRCLFLILSILSHINRQMEFDPKKVITRQRYSYAWDVSYTHFFNAAARYTCIKNTSSIIDYDIEEMETTKIPFHPSIILNCGILFTIFPCLIFLSIEISILDGAFQYYAGAINVLRYYQYPIFTYINFEIS